MSKLAFSVVLTSLGVAALASVNLATGAVESDERKLAEISPTQILPGSADVELRFVQEDGPKSGHVRVELTPATRPLTIWEARSAAQQGFLEALNDEALGDNLTQITVVVRRMPDGPSDPGGAEQVFRFLHRGGRDWTVLLGE